MSLVVLLVVPEDEFFLLFDPSLAADVEEGHEEQCKDDGDDTPDDDIALETPCTCPEGEADHHA